ncbi:MAG: TerB family tellurite resistance protein [Clostridia bacterium]|jgi:hypothetical protein|nr:TerB family tellurite resistance protein [Clostridia bacterium]
MKEFNDLCRLFEELDSETYSELLNEKAARILPALAGITEDGMSGLEIFASFIMGAIVSDNKLTEDEYVLAYPLFRSFFGEAADYSLVKESVKKSRSGNREMKKQVDEMIDILGTLSEDLKDDIVTVCLMICAVDGKVSLSEKRWIKQLIR